MMIKATFKLPKEMIEKTINDINEGQVVYTVPWALAVDENRIMSIDTMFTYTDCPQGTSHMKVTKIGGNFYVDRLSIGDHKYIPGTHYGPPRYCAVAMVDGLPTSPTPKAP